MVGRRQQEILAALTKTMPTGSEGLPLVFSVFVRIRSLFRGSTRESKGEIISWVCICMAKAPPGLQLKGYGK